MPQSKKPTAKPSRKAPKTPTKSRAVRRQSERTKSVPPPSAPAPAMSKLARLEALLRQSGGATLDALIEATGWQAHSIRGAISGTLKKKLGLTIESERIDGQRIYRVVD